MNTNREILNKDGSLYGHVGGTQVGDLPAEVRKNSAEAAAAVEASYAPACALHELLPKAAIL